MRRDVTSLPAALKAGLFSQVRLLLDAGHAATSTDAQGRSALALVCLVEDARWAVSLARLLLEKGAAVGAADANGLTSLHYACLYGREELLPVLLAAADCDLNAADRHGNTPLLYAAQTGRLPLLRSLVAALRRFHLPLDRANRLGVTPLMHAWREGRVAAARFLLQAGADPSRVDADGRSCRSFEAAARAACERQERDAAARQLLLSLRVDDADGWNRYRGLRAVSAPVRRSWQETRRERRLDACVARPQGADVIREDPRNDPAAFPHRPQPPVAHRRRPASPGSWRAEVASLFGQYEGQCSASYREPARPPSPDPSEENRELLLAVETVFDGARSRRGSAMSQRSFAGRRSAKSRKGSACRQSMESVLEDEDIQAMTAATSGNRRSKRLSIDARHLPRAIARPLKPAE